MRFEHFIPCDILKPFVKAFIIQETCEESPYKILPDTSLVLGFQFKGRLSIMNGDHETPLSAFGITGLTDRFKIFKNSRNIGSVLVYFKEGGAAPFLRLPLHELFRESVSLDNFMVRSELMAIEEQLCEAGTDAMRIRVVEQFLISRMSPMEPDKLVAAALGLIHKSKGNIRIADLADQLNMSQSPLEKRFRQAVGTSAKKYTSIVRLKHAITCFSPGKSLTDLVYESGFYDQAHFIKEFKTFTGETPGSYFSSQP